MAGNSLLGIWMSINALMIVSIFASSASCFYYLYCFPYSDFFLAYFHYYFLYFLYFAW